jgi:hypothetical protein
MNRCLWSLVTMTAVVWCVVRLLSDRHDHGHEKSRDPTASISLLRPILPRLLVIRIPIADYTATQAIRLAYAHRQLCHHDIGITPHSPVSSSCQARRLVEVDHFISLLQTQLHQSLVSIMSPFREHHARKRCETHLCQGLVQIGQTQRASLILESP